MALFDWKPEYNTGFDEIDRQHRVLVDLINRLHEKMVQGATQTAVAPILRELANYTRTHFTWEEKMLLSAGYADLPAHKEVHRKMAAKVDSFAEELEAGRIALSVPLMNFLKDWLREHILKTDMKYAHTLRGVHA
jgi:hemerythrin-like metal-binding protein